MTKKKYSKLLLMFFLGFVIMSAVFAAEKKTEKKGEDMERYKVSRTEEEWSKKLPPLNYKILREGGTERPFTGIYNDLYEDGLYRCFACGSPLFRSETKFNHGCGWPSFTNPVSKDSIVYLPDHSHGMVRTEIKCGNCGSHLGHVFNDGPKPARTRYCVNSAALQFMPEKKEKTMTKDAISTAVFAAGCFWGVEYKFGKEKGVVSTAVGYTGGNVVNPRYQLVKTGATGHAEAVKVEFDPKQTDYETLVRFFFSMHNPTQVNRQGPDFGTQYRSAVFYVDENQKKIAEKVKSELQSNYKEPISTEIVPAVTFYLAEEYHQKYIEKNGGGGCAI
jgi:peptide methionine sulfoxide reductase msrA/msrB